MKIQKDSWLVRRFFALTDRYPSDTCDLFGTLFGSWLWKALTIVWIGAMLLILFFGIAAAGKFLFGVITVVSFLCGFVLVSGTVGLIVGAVFLIVTLKDAGFFTWIKGKTCIQLEIVDEIQ